MRTVIGYGSPKAGTNKVHGEAMGPADVAATKKFFGFPEDQSFYVPDDALANWRKAVTAARRLEAEWKQAVRRITRRQFPELAAEFERTQKGTRKAGWEKAIPGFATDKKQATRNAGGAMMNAIAGDVPELFGGAADLTASTKTIFKPGESFHVDPAGRNVFFGVREFGMCAAVNGMAAHGGLVPFGSTFFCFSDYCKAGDSPGGADAEPFAVCVHARLDWRLGEDGPTHQPIEHLMMLRAVPELTDFRPADANETAAAWRLALERNGPCFFALTRQDLPVIDAATHDVYGGVSKGAYVLEDAANPQVMLIGTGSEVWPCRGCGEAAGRGGNSRRAW